jgi:hypothetical protein
MKSVKFVQQGVLVKKNVIEDAMNTIANALKTDTAYRIGWYANLKFNIYDNSNGRISKDKAGEIADVILRNFFKA